jgi:hypothetical protein
MSWRRVRCDRSRRFMAVSSGSDDGVGVDLDQAAVAYEHAHERAGDATGGV